MAETSYPFNVAAPGDPGDLSLESQWSKMARLFAGPGVVGDPGSSACQVFADASGLNVFVRAGEAMLRGHYYNNSAQLAVAIPANGAGSARIDRIVLRLDPTDNEIKAERIAGTAGAGAPALTQTDTGTWDLPLAQVRVEAGATNIAATKVTDERLFSGLDVLPCIAVSQITNPRMGQHAFESSTGDVKKWTGAAWKTLYEEPGAWAPFTPTWTLPSYVPAGGILGNGVAEGRYMRVGKWVKFRLRITLGSTSDAGPVGGGGSAYLFGGLPVPAVSAAALAGMSGMVLANNGTFPIVSRDFGSQTGFIAHGPSGQAVTQSNPGVLTPGAYYHFSGDYEAA